MQSRHVAAGSAILAALVVSVTPAGASLTYNALTFNALTFNALTFNALTFNALTFNALTFNALTFNALTFNALDANGPEINRLANDPRGSSIGSSELTGVDLPR